MARADAAAADIRRDRAAGSASRSGLAAEHIPGTGEETLHGRAFIARFGFVERLQQLFLLGAHPGRRLNQDAGDEIAAAAAIEDAHSGAAVAQLLARLDAAG